MPLTVAYSDRYCFDIGDHVFRTEKSARTRRAAARAGRAPGRGVRRAPAGHVGRTGPRPRRGLPPQDAHRRVPAVGTGPARTAVVARGGRRVPPDRRRHDPGRASRGGRGRRLGVPRRRARASRPWRWPRTSAAGFTMPSPRTARGSACSTTWPWPSACCSGTARLPAPRSSTWTSTRATARRSPSKTTRPSSRAPSTRNTTTRASSPRARSTSACRTAPVTTSTCTPSSPCCRRSSRSART